MGLLKNILELKGKTLICDCPESILCTGDALALEFYATVSGKAIAECGDLTFCHEAGMEVSQSKRREVIPASRVDALAQIPPIIKVARRSTASWQRSRVCTHQLSSKTSSSR